MYNKIVKNYQVNVGIPFQIKSPVNYQNVKMIMPLEKDIADVGVSDKAADAEEIIKKAKEEADLIIQEARYEAMRIIENAEREAQGLQMEAEADARERGYKEGLEEAKRQYDDLIMEANLIKEHAQMEYKDVLEGIESDAINLILDIARNVIGAELSFNREDILYLVRQGFEKCTNKDSVLLKVSPEDYEYIAANKSKLLSMVGGVSDLKIKKDATMKNGSCVIETPFGSIDAGAETKLKKIEEAFRMAVGS